MNRTSPDMLWADLGNDPDDWQHVARNSMAAAEVLVRELQKAWPRGQINVQLPPECMTLWPSVMLKAYALEALFKALWLKMGNQLVVEKKKNSESKWEFRGVPGGNGHDLCFLAKAIGLELDWNDADTLARMSKVSTALGRYPIGVTRRGTDGISWSWKDDECVERIWTMTTAQLAKCIKHP